ncbi:MAG: hypothetical protein WAX14_10895 [Rhodococcus sp. (in: high G+C Gram-positive bacteria)]|uniref:hypothetical protein n=1 Tax=Rhodococcus sp. TaxID=1831 RepID=UPI003BB63176
MTNETTVDWAERDQAARNALNVICDDPGEVKQGWLEVRLRGELVGRVSFYSENDWLVETIEIKVFEAYRFRKDVYAKGEYQPRYSMFVMQALFDQLAGYEIRESPGTNSEPGDGLLHRVREEYGLPYHRPRCFRSEGCICGLGLTRAQVG